MCLPRQLVKCSFQTNGVTLQQTEKFKYLGITFSSEGRQDNKLDTRIGKASAVIRSVVLKRKRCTKAKLSVFKSVFVSILTCGHEYWVTTKKGQATEMGFLQKFGGLSLLDKVKSTTFVNFSASNCYNSA